MAYKEIKACKECGLKEFVSEYFEVGYYKCLKLLSRREIKVNGERVSKEFELKAGDVVGIYLSEADINEVRKQQNYEIIYEDENCLAVYKPQGVLTNADPAQASTFSKLKNIDHSFKAEINPKVSPKNELHKIRESTLFGMLAIKYPTLSAVHRLDRNTCGVVMFSKTNEAYSEFIEAFKDRRVNKIYNAIVTKNEGARVQSRLSKSILESAVPFKVELFLSKDSERGIVSASDTFKPNYLSAVTEFRFLEKRDGLTLLEVKPTSGRTHQIRATIRYAGLCIVGDSKYGSNSVNRLYRAKKQLLACVSLQFTFAETSPLYYLSGKTFVRPTDLFKMLGS